MSAQAKRGVTAAALAAWVILHLYTGIRAFFENMYKSYTVLSWFHLGLWFLALLALAAWLYVTGNAEPLRSLKWFWAFSSGLYGAMALGTLLGWTFPDMAAMVIVICSFATPMHHLSALSGLVYGTAGPELRVLLGFLFCLICFAGITWLHRRAMKKGASPDGSVDPGAGTVE